MRLRLLPTFFVLCCVASVVAAEPLPFTGSWDASESAASSFSLDLAQHGRHLSGYHSAVARDGKRVDAVLPTESSPSITGTVSGKVAHVRFQSGYDPDGHGEALLTLRRDGTLAWRVTRSVGAFCLPEVAILHHQPPSPVPCLRSSGLPLRTRY